MLNTVGGHGDNGRCDRGHPVIVPLENAQPCGPPGADMGRRGESHLTQQLLN
jgi:hypothetical protein